MRSKILGVLKKRVGLRYGKLEDFRHGERGIRISTSSTGSSKLEYVRYGKPVDLKVKTIQMRR